MCKDILKECGWQLPEELLGADVEIYFKDKYGIIQARLGDESIKWNSRGVCMTHKYNLELIEKMWYKYPENFPCLCIYAKPYFGSRVIVVENFKEENSCCKVGGEHFHIDYLTPITDRDKLISLTIKKGRIC
jgi:hypothetical protein